MLAGTTALAQAFEKIIIALELDSQKWKPLPLLRGARAAALV
jgi:hypothetical protein